MIFLQAKMDATPAPAPAPAPAATGMKPTAGVPTAPQPTKIATPPLTGIGMFQYQLCHTPHNDPRKIMTYVRITLFCFLQAPRPRLLGLVANPQV